MDLSIVKFLMTQREAWLEALGDRDKMRAYLAERERIYNIDNGVEEYFIDVHRVTASKLFDVTERSVTGPQRRVAKMACYTFLDQSEGTPGYCLAEQALKIVRASEEVNA